MALNKYMHPKNIYRTPPNFTELAIKYPEFLAISTTCLNGNVKINFKDPEALRTLSKVLLKKDFNLDIEIPIDRLVPAIPLRLNYVLWIEDLLNVLDLPKDETIYGIDIGCGATCIYPLLCNQKNNWMMLATESDKQSFEAAKKNVDKNNKSAVIKIHHNISDQLLLDLPLSDNQTYTFTMCNPPFFASDKDLDSNNKSRSSNRPPPKAAQTGNQNELVVSGGEIAYVKKMINESTKLKSTIRIFTTMLGHKSSVNPLKEEIKKSGAKCLTQTRFCQGRTMRWALAWTFGDYPLYKVPDYSAALKKNNTHSLMFIIPKFDDPEDNSEYKIENVQKIMEQIFNTLQVTYTVLEQLHCRVTYEISAYKNTWSHQRRLRRQQKLLQGTSSSSTSSDNEKLAPTTKLDDLGEKEEAKRIKLDLYLKMAMSIEQEYLESYDSDEDNATIEVNGTLERSDITIKLGYLDGTAGKDGVHQVMQYVINNWRKNIKNI